MDSIALHRGKLTHRMKFWLFFSRKKWQKQGEIARQDMDRGFAAPAISIDVGNTGTVLCPMLYGIGTALPGFREELANVTRRRGVGALETDWHRGIALEKQSHYDGSQPRFMRCLKISFWNLWTRRCETRKTRQTVIIHGIRDSAQAVEIYRILERLKVRGQRDCTALDIVAISSPQLLHQAANYGVDLMKHVHTLAITETGSIIYSPPPPVFTRIWTELFELGATSSSTTSQIINDLTIPTMFNILHRALEDRKKRVTFLSELPVISQGKIRTAISQDSIRIAIILQQISEVESYKHDVGVVPEEEAFSVLNLTHEILDHKLLPNDVILDIDLFKRRAHRLVNILADLLKILPETIAIHGITLMKVILYSPLSFGLVLNYA
ncbi:hypothetical protein C8J57DRAFT_1247343 [Mycena rebaudengoi]|nr:hypothetical protein C8J57DRAFT_1247343 [Mycena rebaudengoi]